MTLCGEHCQPGGSAQTEATRKKYPHLNVLPPISRWGFPWPNPTRWSQADRALFQGREQGGRRVAPGCKLKTSSTDSGASPGMCLPFLEHELTSRLLERALSHRARWATWKASSNQSFPVDGACH